MSFFRQDPAMATLLQGVTQSLAESKSNSQRQDRHEDECGDRYKEISRGLEKLGDTITRQGETFSAKLDKQTANLNAKLYSIGAAIIGGLFYVLYEFLHAKGIL